MDRPTIVRSVKLNLLNILIRRQKENISVLGSKYQNK